MLTRTQGKGSLTTWLEAGPMASTLRSTWAVSTVSDRHPCHVWVRTLVYMPTIYECAPYQDTHVFTAVLIMMKNSNEPKHPSSLKQTDYGIMMQ